MKIAVYAICKNESQFIDRWMDSVREADEIVVLDTGSADDSVEKLRKRGAKVFCEEIIPWRFDRARNRSLELVSEDADLCVCLDLDEVITAGWRPILEACAARGAGRIQYRYVWNYHPDGREGVVFWSDKVHARKGFWWVNPVHEVLDCAHPVQVMKATGFQVEHHADEHKSRAQYLPLLELAVQENPHNDRNMHYLGREYMFHQEWQKCIDTLNRHVRMPEATWADERSASWRFMARAYRHLGDLDAAQRSLLHALAEAPHLREPWVESALFDYFREDWSAVVYHAEHALEIRVRPDSYICDAESWGETPHDLLSLGYYYTGRNEQAVEQVKKALSITPNNERLKNNLRIMQNALRSC